MVNANDFENVIARAANSNESASQRIQRQTQAVLSQPFMTGLAPPSFHCPNNAATSSTGDTIEEDLRGVGQRFEPNGGP